MAGGDTLYKIRSLDLRDVIVECNRIFELLSDRLDRIEGLRGTAQVFGKQLVQGDGVFPQGGTGPVVSDDGNPAGYWRLAVDTSGTVSATSLGKDYE